MAFAIVCNFRKFVGHLIPSIWLKFGMKSCFRVLITEWIKVPFICLGKKRESALSLPLYPSRKNISTDYREYTEKHLPVLQAVLIFTMESPPKKRLSEEDSGLTSMTKTILLFVILWLIRQRCTVLLLFWKRLQLTERDDYFSEKVCSCPFKRDIHVA